MSTCYGADFILIDVAGEHCANREAVGALSAMFARHAGIDFCLTVPADWEAPHADLPAEKVSPLRKRYLAFTSMFSRLLLGNRHPEQERPTI